MQPNAPAADLNSAMIVTLVLVVVFIMLPAWGVVSLIAWRKRRRETQQPPDRSLPPRVEAPQVRSYLGGRLVVSDGPKGGNTSFAAWLFIGFMVVIGIVVSQISPARPRAPRPAAPVPSARWFFGIPALLLGGYALWVAYLYWKHRDPDLATVTVLFQAGQKDEARARLQELVEARPTVARANALALMFIDSEHWDDAFKHLLLARDLGLDAKTYANNLAIVLRKLGRPVDALAMLEPLVNAKNPSVVLVDTYVHILLDLGRIDDALLWQKKSEELFAQQAGAFGTSAPLVRQSMDLARNRYDELLGKSKKAGVDTGDELA